MLKVSSIKIHNMQSKQNRTCSLDDIIKENIKNNKSLSEIDLTKTNDFDLSNDNAFFMMVNIKMKLKKLIILEILMKLIS
ncbi:hypothetical protein [Arsenophonus nasoniae]|uniref:Uncharacterized protein n=1 Tax=Arsenophonus nasoniae TaxID=638 RepID=A0AA95K399_9GAMM|nr:hypothetical protein [Arsenophonus nasoniae]WGL94785.1 hypothetical protein QE207_13950 [Arsenophonus nasoniae]